MIQRTLLGVALIAVLALVLWGSDRITLQGERTIFTVNCDRGNWQGSRCTGDLVVGEQYAFRASRTRNEVFYWVRGSNAPSGKFSDCMVKDRDNWTCNVQIDQKPALTFEMSKGKPTRGGLGLAMPFHSVPKWKWWALKLGVHAFANADE
jgi:hypothetical protein